MRLLAGNRRRIRFHRGDRETCPEYEVVRADAALVLLSSVSFENLGWGVGLRQHHSELRVALLARVL